jgi:cytochrome P450
MDSAAGGESKASKCPVAGGGALGSLTDPEVIAHPQPFYRAMRSQDPVYYDEKIGMYLVTRYEDIVEVLEDPITYSDKMGFEAMYAEGHFEEFKQILERDGGGFFPDLIKDDPPAHTRVRRLMERAFTAHRVKTLEPPITQVIVDLVEEIADRSARGEVVEAMSEFAVPLTIRVICEQLGITHANADNIARWSRASLAQLSSMQNREQMLENVKHMCEMQNFIIAEMKARQAEPREDMISDIVHARLEDGSTLALWEGVGLIKAFIVAGNDTTASAIGNLLLTLATEPEVVRTLEQAAEDDRLLTRFVEELLRNKPPVQGLARMTIREVELGGKRLPAGAHMLVLFASGNDDDTVFACPERFDPNRANLGRHVAFGLGVHRCIGSALARMEIKVTARELIRRLAHIELAAPREQIGYLPTVSTHTLSALPIRLRRRG